MALASFAADPQASQARSIGDLIATECCSMANSLKRRFSARQPALVDDVGPQPETQAVLDDEQKAADEELQRQIAANFTEALEKSGASPVAIAEACGVTEQAVSNWKRTGKIRTRHLMVVSRLTGWPIQRLLTGETTSAIVTAEPPPPPYGYKDRHQVSDSDWALLQDIKDAQEAPHLAERLQGIRREIESLREFAKRYHPVGSDER